MKTKQQDKRYCGVREFMVKGANPRFNTINLAHLAQFIRERYRIYYRKDVLRKPAPWTKNPILKEYKFTNVFRENDRVSKALIHLVSENDTLTYQDKVINTFLFRSWNNPRTFVDLGGPWRAAEIYNGLDLKEKVRPEYERLKEADPERKWWSNAYNQGGTKCVWKFPDGSGYSRGLSKDKEMLCPDYEPDIPLRVFHIGPWLKEKRLFKRMDRATDQQEVYEAIKELPGFASFLSYQIFVDLTYIKEFPFSENEFTVAGPGCKRGLDSIFIDYDGMTYEEALFYLRDSIDWLFTDLWRQDRIAFEWDPDGLFKDRAPDDRYLNVMSLENCFCELSKYIKAVNGVGRPKNTYKPYTDKGELK